MILDFARRALRLILKLALWLLVLVSLFLLVRAFESRRGPELGAWHRITLANEVHAGDVADAYTWAQYQAAEARLFDEMAAKLAPGARPGRYRYDAGSQLGAPAGTHDWNRSYESTPATIRGGVVLLHGMSDGPYSMRHLVARYEQAGYVVIVPRLPGHGTVPAGLLDVRWQDWSAVVRVAMRELRARTGPGKPLHLVGYSNGGALAVKYALDIASSNQDDLPRADRIVLLSPMIGISPGAGLSRLLPMFGGIPYFEKSLWLDIQPEFNPYKYNSFPVNAAIQSYLLTTLLQAEILQLQARDRLGRLPPILSFQSVLDNTVETRAVVHALFDHLPANGSELVLFDINRASVLAPLLTPSATGFADTLRGKSPRTYRLTLVSNTSPDTLAVSERSFAAGSDAFRERPLGLAFPQSVYSLSHVAVPFPVDDGLYGLEPRLDEDVGIRLGTIALHGERGALVISADQLMRLNCNPFFPYLVERLGESLPADTARPARSSP